MSDLIERLKYLAAGYEMDDPEAIELAITALSPVLPDDVVSICVRLLVHHDRKPTKMEQDAADMLKRQAREREAPILPDDVKLQIQIARDKHAYMLARKPEFGPPDEITANFIGELADLLERQAREVKRKELIILALKARVANWDEMAERIEELKAEHEKWDVIASQENERLQAQVEELESYTKHLETEWVLTDDLDEARASWAALQENEL